jgi:hypothetical protein
MILSTFDEKCPQNGSKNGETAPTPETGYNRTTTKGLLWSWNGSELRESDPSAKFWNVLDIDGRKQLSLVHQMKSFHKFSAV